MTSVRLAATIGGLKHTTVLKDRDLRVLDCRLENLSEFIGDQFWGARMTVNEVAVGLLSVVVAYLFGSIPSAYIVARRVTGEDIRGTSGGVVGGLNVYREVGIRAGIIVILADITKGIVAVSLAYWLFRVPQVFVLLAGLAAVAGHLWMVFLKFSGGGAIATSVGVLSTLMLVYGYWAELLVLFTLMTIVIVITRNAAASAVASLFFLPLIVWLGTRSLPVTVFTIILGLMMGLKRVPAFRKEIVQAKSLRDYVFRSSFKRHRR